MAFLVQYCHQEEPLCGFPRTVHCPFLARRVTRERGLGRRPVSPAGQGIGRAQACPRKLWSRACGEGPRLGCQARRALWSPVAAM